MADDAANAFGDLALNGEIPTKEQFRAKAIEAGWVETTNIDHEEYSSLSKSNWMGAAHAYEWNGEFGEVAPEDETTEKYLFGSKFRMRQGEHLANLDFSINMVGPNRVPPVRSFDEAALHPVVKSNVQKSGFVFPTVIQQYTIPSIINGNDLVAVSQTGSGKTAAYLIPVISKLMGKAKKLCATRGGVAYPLVAIVVPTRELAIQVFDEACRLTYRSMLRPCAVYGGMSTGIMKDELRKGCDIVIGTPGRLCDIMKQPEIFSMSKVRYTIIDEADELLKADWDEELRLIMEGGDTNHDAGHQFLMFSATFPKDVRCLAIEYMGEDNFVTLTVGRGGSSHRNIHQDIIFVDSDQKSRCIYDLLMNTGKGDRTLIFCNSKRAVDFLDDELYNKGLPTTSIHSGRGQAEREDSMRAFKTGRCPILIATGVSARGWDIKDIEHVVNFDLPQKMYGGIDEYTHRIGRTGRIGHQGHATSFYNERDEELAEDLVKVLLENQQAVPDFLQQYVPEDGKLHFDEDSDDQEGGVPADDEEET